MSRYHVSGTPPGSYSSECDSSANGVAVCHPHPADGCGIAWTYFCVLGLAKDSCRPSAWQQSALQCWRYSGWFDRILPVVSSHLHRRPSSENQIPSELAGVSSSSCPAGNVSCALSPLCHSLFRSVFRGDQSAYSPCLLLLLCGYSLPRC